MAIDAVMVRPAHELPWSEVETVFGTRGDPARVIDGYPIDVAAREKVSSADLYHGPLSLFEAEGFSVVARPMPGRALVTLTV